MEDKTCIPHRPLLVLRQILALVHPAKIPKSDLLCRGGIAPELMNQPRCVKDNPLAVISRGLAVQALLHQPLHLVSLQHLIHLDGRDSLLFHLLHLLLDLLEILVRGDLSDFHQGLRIQNNRLFCLRDCKGVFTFSKTLLGQLQILDNTRALLPVRLVDVILPLVEGDDLGLGVAKADIFKLLGPHPVDLLPPLEEFLLAIVVI